MTQGLFELYVTPNGAKKFVQDWIHTEASLWSDVQVTITRQDEMYTILIRVSDNSEHFAYVRDTIFGPGGELTKKFWFAICHTIPN